jgi:hypothetical protein
MLSISFVILFPNAIIADLTGSGCFFAGTLQVAYNGILD